MYAVDLTAATDGYRVNGGSLRLIAEYTNTVVVLVSANVAFGQMAPCAGSGGGAGGHIPVVTQRIAGCNFTDRAGFCHGAGRCKPVVTRSVTDSLATLGAGFRHCAGGIFKNVITSRGVGGNFGNRRLRGRFCGLCGLSGGSNFAFFCASCGVTGSLTRILHITVPAKAQTQHSGQQ